MDTSRIPPEFTPGAAKSPLRKAVQRLELCKYAIEEAHMELEQPLDPEEKADLLLVTEDLMAEAFELMHTAKRYAWGEGHQDNDFPEEEDY